MSNILFEHHDDIAVITIDRPEVRNALDTATGIELLDAVRRFEGDKTLSVGIVTGSGDTFCAGADLKSLEQDLTWSPDFGHGPLGPTWQVPAKPMIAAVEGFAVAGGLEIALWCDLRVAARDATFGVFCRRWGVPLIDGGTVRLPRLIGQSRALDMILTGRAVSGEEAGEIGLANRLCEPGEALTTAMELARTIAAHPQQCMLTDRQSAWQQAGQPIESAIAGEAERGWRYLQEGTFRAGVGRFNRGDGRHGEGT